MNGRSHPRPLLLLAVGALCLSFAAVFVKMVSPEVIGPTAIGFWRTLIGGGLLFAAAAVSGKRLIISRRLMAWSALAGFIFFLDLFFWHRSIIIIGAGLATILAMTQVFVTAALSYAVFKERLSMVFLVAAASAIAGVTLLIGVGSDIEFTTRYLIGIGLGLLTGLAYGSYLVTMKKVGHRQDHPGFLVFMAWTSAFTAGFMLLSCLIEQVAIIPGDLQTWLVLAALGLVVQAAGWWLVTYSLPKIDASRGSLMLVLQPVLATAWGALLFAERLTWLQLVGAAITITAIYVGSVRRSS